MYKCSPELMKELRKAIRATSAMRSHVVVCPFCGHKLFSVYEGTTGFIETKCSKCKKIILLIWFPCGVLAAAKKHNTVYSPH